jgi:SAM-dependent methyltransferase
MSGQEKDPVDERQGDQQLSTSAIKYLAAVDQLKGTATHNVHTLLKDLVHTKTDQFLDMIVLNNGRIDHLGDIIEGRVSLELESLYEACSPTTAKDASVSDHHRKENSNDNSLVYGEVEFASFLNLLPFFPKSKGGVFYDLGSGSGRAVFTVRFTLDFDRCIGIELLPNLHKLAVDVTEVYNQNFRHKLALQSVEFYCEDVLNYDWSDGTVIFACSTCFEDDLINAIGEKAKDLQQGAYLITLKKFTGIDSENVTGIDPDAFDIIQEAVCPMSWGDADVFVYRRR